jgi:hypothetical protein
MDFDSLFSLAKSNSSFSFTYSSTTTACVYREDGKREVTVKHREVQGANGKVKTEKNQAQKLLLDASGKSTKTKPAKAKTHGGKTPALALMDG